jgi:hypothetical protein
MICSRCGGFKEVLVFENVKYYFMERCYNCDGSGKVDWITNIFKKDQTTFNRDESDLPICPNNYTSEDFKNFRCVYKYKPWKGYNRQYEMKDIDDEMSNM